MTKQEIEQAIENGEKLWFYEYDNDYDEWGVVEVDTKYFRWSNNENCYTHFNKEAWKTNPKPYKMYNDYLFKTKEEAEFVAKNWCSRTEKFEPPLWEDLKDNGIYRFIDKNGAKCKIECFYEDRVNRGFIDVTQAGTGMIEDLSYTKENYLKAVEYARKLFLGESV